MGKGGSDPKWRELHDSLMGYMSPTPGQPRESWNAWRGGYGHDPVSEEEFANIVPGESLPIPLEVENEWQGLLTELGMPPGTGYSGGLFGGEFGTGRLNEGALPEGYSTQRLSGDETLAELRGIDKRLEQAALLGMVPYREVEEAYGGEDPMGGFAPEEVDQEGLSLLLELSGLGGGGPGGGLPGAGGGLDLNALMSLLMGMSPSGRGDPVIDEEDKLLPPNVQPMVSFPTS